jgi:ATP-dependent Lhr-like helicase
MFDSAMLLSEFARAGAVPDDLLTLCTLDLARRFGQSARSLSLEACAQAEGVHLNQAHTAHDDALATVQLLRRYLQRAQQAGHEWLDEIGATGALPSRNWAPWAPSDRCHTRSHAPAATLRQRLPIPALGSQAQIIYADHLARAALSPKTFTSQLSTIRDTAHKLELTPSSRSRVHSELKTAWQGHSEALQLLKHLDTL